MPSDVVEPPTGPTNEPDAAAPVPPPAPEADRRAGVSSADDLNAFLTEGRPDPMLGEFVDRGGPCPPPGVSAGSFDTVTGATAPPAVVESSGDALTSLGLADLDPNGTAESMKAHPPASDEEEVDDADGPTAPSWAFLLLASYASAVTIGLVWVLWTGRKLREDYAPDDPPTAESQADPGRRSDRSRRVSPSRPQVEVIPAALGQTVTIGHIEVTPLAITSGPVKLERTLTQAVTRNGGKGALTLRVRLKNVSSDTVIAPLDEAFVREREPGHPDSFIESAPERPVIEMYPLAVESEWSIVGQEFRDLGPGESFETVVVSAPEATTSLAPELTWRLRLRTDINRTDDLGVRFKADDVRQDP